MCSFSAMKKSSSEKLENWSIFFWKKDFFLSFSAMCDYFLCIVLCMKESFVFCFWIDKYHYSDEWYENEIKGMKN